MADSRRKQLQKVHDMGSRAAIKKQKKDLQTSAGRKKMEQAIQEAVHAIEAEKERQHQAMAAEEKRKHHACQLQQLKQMAAEEIKARQAAVAANPRKQESSFGIIFFDKIIAQAQEEAAKVPSIDNIVEMHKKVLAHGAMFHKRTRSLGANPSQDKTIMDTAKEFLTAGAARCHEAIESAQKRVVESATEFANTTKTQGSKVAASIIGLFSSISVDGIVNTSPSVDATEEQASNGSPASRARATSK